MKEIVPNGKGIQCVSKRYDEDLDIVWGKFKLTDEQGDVFFEMPINDHDFELSEYYIFTIKNVLYADDEKVK